MREVTGEASARTSSRLKPAVVDFCPMVRPAGDPPDPRGLAGEPSTGEAEYRRQPDRRGEVRVLSIPTVILFEGGGAQTLIGAALGTFAKRSCL
jgi:hypothetical protein